MSNIPDANDILMDFEVGQLPDLSKMDCVVEAHDMAESLEGWNLDMVYASNSVCDTDFPWFFGRRFTLGTASKDTVTQSDSCPEYQMFPDPHCNSKTVSQDVTNTHHGGLESLLIDRAARSGGEMHGAWPSGETRTPTSWISGDLEQAKDWRQGGGIFWITETPGSGKSTAARHFANSMALYPSSPADIQSCRRNTTIDPRLLDSGGTTRQYLTPRKDHGTW